MESNLVTSWLSLTQCQDYLANSIMHQKALVTLQINYISDNTKTLGNKLTDQSFLLLLLLMGRVAQIHPLFPAHCAPESPLSFWLWFFILLMGQEIIYLSSVRSWTSSTITCVIPCKVRSPSSLLKSTPAVQYRSLVAEDLNKAFSWLWPKGVHAAVKHLVSAEYQVWQKGNKQSVLERGWMIILSWFKPEHSCFFPRGTASPKG